MAVKATGQITITDLNDINISSTQPVSPRVDQLWLDSSVVPNILQRWSGTKWIIVNDYSEELAKAVPYIKGTHTTTTANWTGVAPFKTLENGQQITYLLTGIPTGNATLNLTLSNGSSTGFINCYYGGASRLTTHYSQGNVIRLTYLVNNRIGSTDYTGWWADANYDSNTDDRIRYNWSIKAKSAITAGYLIVADSTNTFFNLTKNIPFEIDKPILYAGSAISVNSTGNNNFTVFPSGISVRNNSSNSTLSFTQYKPLYIEGTLNGLTFTPIGANLFTDTPTNQNSIYMLIGQLYSTYQTNLISQHDLYKFDKGVFKSFSEIVTTNTTSINTINGNISTLISETEISKLQGEGTTFYDKYVKTEQDLEGITSTVGFHSSSLQEVSLVDKYIESGKSVSTELADDSVVHVNVDGLSEQVVTVQSKNLNSGIRPYGYNSVGVYTTSLTSNTCSKSYLSVLNTNSYTFKNARSTNGTITLFFYDATHTFISSITGSMASGLYILPSASIPATCKYLNWHTLSFVLALTDALQIEVGTVATAYTTFVPSSPSPDYPSAITNLNSCDVVSSIGGRNLLLGTKDMSGSDRPTYVTTEEYMGLTVATGTAPTSGFLDFFADKTPILTGLDYTVSFYAKSSSTTQTIACFFYSPNTTTHALSSTGHNTNNNDGFCNVNITNVWTRYWVTWNQSSSGSEKSLIVGRLSTSNTGDVSVCGVKFEEGSVSTPWTPAPEDIPYKTLTNSTYKVNIPLSTPLRSVGNTHDKIFKDIDGYWKRQNNTGSVVLNGSENGWALNSTRYTLPCLAFNRQISGVSLVADSHVLSDKFKRDINATYLTSEGIMKPSANDFIVIGINASRLITQDTSGFKTWLALNPVTVTYQLANPTTETLSSELQTLLNNIPSFNGNTYVYTVSNINPNITCKFKSVGWYNKYLQTLAIEGKANSDYVNSLINATVTNTQSLIQQRDDSITASIDSKIATLDGSITQKYSSDIQATVNSFNLKFSNVQSLIENGNQNISEINSYFDFSTNGMEIGKVGSPLKINIANDQMDFKNGEAVVAYINGQKMYIPNLDVVDSLEVGQHKIEKYSDTMTIIRFIG